MDGFHKLLEAFGKIAPHLRNELVLAGFVFVAFIGLSIFKGDQSSAAILAGIIIVGLFTSLFYKLQLLHISERSKKGDEVEIEAARRLMDFEEEVDNIPLYVRHKLIDRARRMFIRAERPDLASDAQNRIDDLTPPPPDPDPPA